MSDPVNHPAHYVTNGVEAITVIEQLGLRDGFCRGNAIKYLWRAGRKGDVRTDVEKALWYVNRMLGSADHGVLRVGQPSAVEQALKAQGAGPIQLALVALVQDWGDSPQLQRQCLLLARDRLNQWLNATPTKADDKAERFVAP